MSKIIGRHCPKCKQYAQVPVIENASIECPQCHEPWGKIGEASKILDICPVCSCRQFYISKDFNQALGCSIMLVGIVLVPWTYGLSLPVFALIDWALHRNVPNIINCYKCGMEFRGFENTKNLKSFMHHIGLKYDKFRHQY